MTEALQNPETGEVWQKDHDIVPVPHESIRRAVLHYAALCLPDNVHWCGATPQEHQILQSRAAAEAQPGLLPPIIGKQVGPAAHPDAKGASASLAGADSRGSLRRLFHQSMKGRTMYVLPFVVPAEGAEPEIVGIQLTDSSAVTDAVETAFPSGDRAWAHLAAGQPFWVCLHATGKQETPDDRVRWEFPLERTLWAYGPGYGVPTLRRVLRGQ